MDFVDLIRKIFGAREEKDRTPLFMFCGEEMMLVTDKTLAVYLRDPHISGGMQQVPVPLNMTEVDTFDPFLRYFLDPEGDEVEGVVALEDAPDVIDRIFNTMSDIRKDIISDVQKVPDKIKSAVLSNKDFKLTPSDKPGAVTILSSTAKTPALVDNFYMGPSVTHGANAISTRIPLNMFRKEEHTMLYCAIRRAINISFTSGGEEFGALIPLRFDIKLQPIQKPKTEQGAEMTKAEEEEQVKNILAQASKPIQAPPAGVQTEIAAQAHVPTGSQDNPPPILSEDIKTSNAKTTMENAKAAAASKVPEDTGAFQIINGQPTQKIEATPGTQKTEEVAPPVFPPKIDAPKAEDIELPATEENAGDETPEELSEPKAPETDEDRLFLMMEEFESGKISAMRNELIFLERLVKLQAKLLKKGAGSAKLKEENAVLKKENAEMKKQAASIEKAKAAMAAALA